MKRPLLLVASLAAATPAGAQSDEILYQSWSWMKEPSAARAAGLAGAMTAVADDASSTEANPAALTTLSKSELLATVLSRGAGQTAIGTSISARTGTGLLGLAGRLSSRWAIGAYLIEPHSARITLGALRLPEGVREEGHLDVTVKEVGVSTAWRLASPLHLGVRVTASHLRLQGEYTQQPPETGPPLLQAHAEGGETRMAVSVGLLYEATPRLRLGLVRLTGARWDVQTTAFRPTTQAVEGVHEVRQPSVVSAGLSLRASRKVMVAGQLDYLRFGNNNFATLAAAPAAPAPAPAPAPFPAPSPAPAAPVPRSPRKETAWEPRVGVEVSLPLRSVSLQLRAGLRSWSSENATRTDPRLLPSVGASLATGGGLRFDLAGRFGGERSAFLAGASVRF